MQAIDKYAREVKSALNQTTDLRNNRKKMNVSSGFFVFNEEDMKNMTEMSPKNLTLAN